jgi:hypothetical protein
MELKVGSRRCLLNFAPKRAYSYKPMSKNFTSPPPLIVLNVSNRLIILPFGAKLTNDNSTLKNLDGATLYNLTGATINNIDGAVITNSANIVNNSQINNSSMFVVTSTGVVAGIGTYTQTSGTTQVDGTWTQGLTLLLGGLLHGTGTVGGTLRNQATVQGDGATGITLTGAVSGAGIYLGKVTFTGGLSPGDSPALITGQTMVFGASNTLTMEIGGLTRCAEYDAIDAVEFDLGGTLEIDFVDLGGGMFNPHAGDFFDIMDAMNFVGAFSAFNLPTLSGGLVWENSLVDVGGGLRAYRLMVEMQQINATPEPDTMLLMMVGLMLLMLLRHRGGRVSAVKRRIRLAA